MIGIIRAAIAGPTLALQILSHPVLRKAYEPILFDRGKDPRTLTGTDRLQTARVAVGLFGNGMFPLYELGLIDALDQISLQSPSMSLGCWDWTLQASGTVVGYRLGLMSCSVPSQPWSNRPPVDLAITSTFRFLLGPAQRIYHLPLRQSVWKLNEIPGENIVLIGDAYQLMLPSNEQEMLFAIENASVLANALLNNSSDNTGDFATALMKHGNSRIHRSKDMTTAAYWAARLVLGETWCWRLLRSLGVKALPEGGSSGSRIKNLAPRTHTNAS